MAKTSSSSTKSSPPPARVPAGRSRFALVHRIVKVLAFVIGGGFSLVSFMSLVGVVTANGWVRFIVGAVLLLAMTFFVVDRLISRKSKLRGPGFATDMSALVLMVFAFLYVGALQPLTKTLLVREADRLSTSGFPFVARLVWYCAGAAPKGK